MARYTHPQRPDVAEVRRVQDKLLAYPRAGVHFGAGRHVTMPGTWDGTPPAPPGWTETHATIVANGGFSVELRDDLSDRLAADGSRLTGPERATLQSAINASSSAMALGRSA